jgi:divalent metal cation (Fe/Co/Zn/Cd) transporter
VEFDSDLSFRDLSAVINEVEASIRKAVPFSALIYIEPAVDPDPPDGDS